MQCGVLLKENDSIWKRPWPCTQKSWSSAKIEVACPRICVSKNPISWESFIHLKKREMKEIETRWRTFTTKHWKKNKLKIFSWLFWLIYKQIYFHLLNVLWYGIMVFALHWLFKIIIKKCSIGFNSLQVDVNLTKRNSNSVNFAS